jgi:anti-anti-sigma factor
VKGYKMETKDTSSERVFIIKDELIASNIKKYEDIFNRFIIEDDRDIILDLTDVTKIDSMSIASLIRVKKKLIESERTLKLTNPNEGVLRVLDLSGLETYFLE